MVKDTPVGAPIDRSQRQGSPLLLLLITLAVVGAVVGTVLVEEHLHAFYLTMFLAVFAAIGVIGAFLYAVGFLQFAGRAARNDITRAMADTDSAGVLVLDREGKVLYANAAYQALCGAPGARIAGIRPVERLLSGSPEVSEATYRLAQAAREGRKASEVMRLVPALSGEAPYAWYRVSVRALPRAEGEAQYWTVQDVTRERERNENEFQELQQAISYLDNAPAGFFCLRPDGRLSYLNATLAEWLDLDIAEAAERGLTIADISAGQGAALVNAVTGRPGEIRTETIDLDLKRKGGQTLPVRLLHHVAFAADGTRGISRTLVLNRAQGQGGSDLEAGRAAEVRFARFFNNSPLAIATLAKDGTVLTSNARFATLLPEGAGPGLRLNTLLAEADRAKVEAAFAEALAGRSEIAPVDATLAMEGSRSARFHFVPAGALEGEGEAVLAYLIETTEEKKLQEQFFQSMKMSAIGQLAGGVAHDFNNHLQAILGFADLLIGNYRATDPRYQDVMQIKYSANRAKALVRQLLAFSRQQTLLPEAIDLGEQLSELTNLLKRSIGPKVDLEVRHGRDLWGIYADVASFDNMVLNLAVNARDAMPEGGRLIVRTANVRAADCAQYAVEGMKPADYVLIEVSDTGTGMSEEVKKKIFEPFFTTKEVGRGTGLGLSSVYGFISQSNGYIDCVTELGKGTSFRIFLPRHDVPVVDLPAPLPPEPGVAPSATAPAPMAASEGAAPVAPIADHTGKGTILLVEDEDAVRAFGSRALRSRGYTVIEAQSGVDALEQVGNRIDDIDLVVSDVVMPEMDGPTLLKELRARNPELRVIFVSGYAEEAFRKNLPEGQQFDFLPKPFGLKQLVEKVKEVME